MFVILSIILATTKTIKCIFRMSMKIAAIQIKRILIWTLMILVKLLNSSMTINDTFNYNT